MILIKHRVNTIEQLLSLQVAWGAEIDVRSDVCKTGHLHLSHDPWVRGEDFEKWLEAYKKRNCAGPLIINTKEDGLESCILDCLRKFEIGNFFFLDTALPTLVRWVEKEKKNFFAVRLSSFEPCEFVERFVGKAQWLWVDCFDGAVLPKDLVSQFKDRYRICLVSPELQGFPADSIRFRELIPVAYAVCTKVPELWEKQFV